MFPVAASALEVRPTARTAAVQAARASLAACAMRSMGGVPFPFQPSKGESHRSGALKETDMNYHLNQ
ncbi:hypothetical protein GCM10010360_19670 [Streptomyces nogalater]